jgi:hypothetical protein
MLKVAVEPSNPTDLGALVKGLKLLNQADPLVVYTVSHKGEHVLAAGCNWPSTFGSLHQGFAGEVRQGLAGGLKAVSVIQGDSPRRRCWLNGKHEGPTGVC